jgi:outer membrane beta-barrel protein
VKARPWKLGLVSLLMLSLVGLSGPAMAQELEEEEEAGLPELDDDDPMYWAQMRDVYTMQRRAFLKEGRFALSAYAGLIPNNIFEQYFPLGLRANYYILENIGLELSSSYAFRRSTDLRPILTEDSGINARDVLIGDKQVSHTVFGVQWSPAYGKFALGDSGLFYFDLNVFGGAGMVVVQTESEFNAPPDTTVKPEGVIGAGAAIFLGQHAGLRVDFRQFVFQKVEGIGGVANPSEVSVGFSWFF